MTQKAQPSPPRRCLETPGSNEKWELKGEKWGAGHISAGWSRILEEADPLLLEVRGLVDQPTEMPLELATATYIGVPFVLLSPLLLSTQHLSYLLGFPRGHPRSLPPGGQFRARNLPESSGPLNETGEDSLRGKVQVGTPCAEPPFFFPCLSDCVVSYLANNRCLRIFFRACIYEEPAKGRPRDLFRKRSELKGTIRGAERDIEHGAVKDILMHKGFLRYFPSRQKV